MTSSEFNIGIVTIIGIIVYMSIGASIYLRDDSETLYDGVDFTMAVFWPLGLIYRLLSMVVSKIIRARKNRKTENECVEDQLEELESDE